MNQPRLPWDFSCSLLVGVKRVFNGVALFRSTVSIIPILLIVLFSGCRDCSCNKQNHLSKKEKQILEIAKEKIKEQMGNSLFEKYKPYRIKLEGDKWRVHGCTHSCAVGGGAPQVDIDTTTLEVSPVLRGK